jgi:GT2 family glycosyltransferase
MTVAEHGRIGVVVVTHNGLEDTRVCLCSLVQVRYPAVRIVVVDNASKDGTPEAVRREFPTVELLPQSENLGFTGGNNIGIRSCLDHGCDAVLVLNSDTRVEPDFLQHMAPHAAKQAIVTPEIRSLDRPDRAVTEIEWFDWRRGLARSRPPARSDDEELPCRIASGCCLLIPRAIFERIGFLDENFFLYYEDVDFVVRAQLAGFALVHEPAATIYHRESVAPRDPTISPLKLYYNTRNRLYLMRKHSRVTGSFLGYFFATRLAYAAHYILRGNLGPLLSIVRGVRDFWRGRLARVDYRW